MLNAMWNFAVILVIGLERGEIVGEGMEKRQYEGSPNEAVEKIPHLEGGNSSDRRGYGARQRAVDEAVGATAGAT